MLMPRLCRFEKVIDHLVIIGLYTVPIMIAKSDLEEGIRFSLVCSLLEPGKCLIIILIDANALVVTFGKKGLAIGVTRFSCYSIISYCLRSIFLHS